MAGRGFGKSRTGAEFVFDEVFAGRMERVALVGPTAGDVRDVMIEGESGLVAVCQRHGFPIRYEPSKRRVTFPNGALATAYSADEPDRLRGPQHDGAWSDELASWRFGQAAWDNLQFGLRLGSHPRQIVTTTPKPVSVVRTLVRQAAEPDSEVVVTGGHTNENAANLAPSFLATVHRRHAGTRLGRQELGGELLEDVEGALWTLDLIDRFRLRALPAGVETERLVVGVDPPAKATGAECGIVVAGRGTDKRGYVLDDRSRQGTPNEWATTTIAAYDAWHADAVVIEVNQGGDMATNTLKTIRPTLPIVEVHASRGKQTRAQPVSSLYEQGRVSHVGYFPALEDQQCQWVPGDASPDRMDACLVAGTIVATKDGLRPIETIEIGNLVATRRGWKRVTNAGMTSPRAQTLTVVLSDGTTLTGTGNHPVFVHNREWISLDSLVCGDILMTWNESKCARLFGSRESAIRGFHLLAASISACTTGLLVAAAKTRSIARFGRRTTVPFPRGAISTTTISTPQTTNRKTSSVSLRTSTRWHMPPSTRREDGVGLTRSDRLPLSGMVRSKASRGTVNTDGERGRIANRHTLWSVPIAVGRVSRSLLRAAALGIATGGVIGLRLTPSAAMRSTPSVPFAGGRSSKANTAQSRKHAPVSVVRSYANGSAPVYNLSVEEQPEYFANGVLVHNCVWALTDLVVDVGATWEDTGTDLADFFAGAGLG